MKLSRRTLLKGAAVAGASAACARSSQAQPRSGRRPNILFAMADDWSWPHASIAGCRELATPNFDRVANNGALFANAYAAAPQCSPNRAAILTGRAIWQNAEAGTHGSIFPNTHPVYPSLLEDAGYATGFTGKGWGPGDWRRGGFTKNPAGNEYNEKTLASVPASGIGQRDYYSNFRDFLSARRDDQPFCFWYGASEPHRRYEAGSGATSGKNANNAAVPEFLPNTASVRNDLVDYFLEIEWFDRHLGMMLDHLESIGELDNTLVIVTSDNGMPFPRAKANLYDYGIHMPLAVQWPDVMKPANKRDESLISFIDFAPTILEAAGLDVPSSVTGKSFLHRFRGDQSSTHRTYALAGRERHTHARYDNLGYPARALRYEHYLYIRNMKADRWPAGDPGEFHDIDSSPSKTVVINELGPGDPYFEAAVGKRPEEELFDITADPACMYNLATLPDHAKTKDALWQMLSEALTQQGDPRLHGHGDIFESYPRMSNNMRPELGGFAESGEYNPKYATK